MQVPGVIACYSGKEMVKDEIGDLPCGWMVNGKDGRRCFQHHPPLAVDAVNYVGEPFAIVIAESIEAARQGVDAAAVEFEELNPVVDLSTAAVRTTLKVYQITGPTSGLWGMKRQRARLWQVT